MANEKNQELDGILDRLLDGKRPEEILGEGGLAQELTKRLVERALEGEMTHHLGYGKHDPAGRNRRNSRNGKGRKKIQTGANE